MSLLSVSSSPLPLNVAKKMKQSSRSLNQYAFPWKVQKQTCKQFDYHLKSMVLVSEMPLLCPLFGSSWNENEWMEEYKIQHFACSIASSDIDTSTFWCCAFSSAQPGASSIPTSSTTVFLVTVGLPEKSMLPLRWVLAPGVSKIGGRSGKLRGE